MIGVLKAQPTFDYEQPLQSLKGVGPHTLQCLHKLKLYTFRDLLFHFPIRYEDRTRLTPIRDLRPHAKVLIQGKVVSTKRHRSGKKRWLELLLQEGHDAISVIMFHFSKKQEQVFSRQPLVRCYGEFKPNAKKRALVHPEIQFIQNEDEPLLATLTPIYPTTQGLYQNLLRKLIHQVLNEYLAHDRSEHLPKALIEQYQLMPFQEALQIIHMPNPEHDLNALLSQQHPAYKRFIVEEVFVHFITLMRLRAQMTHEQAMPLGDPQQYITQFIMQLPFELTGAQKRAHDAIALDLAENRPMMRLIQGDVGSGKTAVAAMAALYALSSHSQAALLAPTDILASQHYEQFQAWFEPLGIEVLFLSGKTPAKVKKEYLEKIKSQDQLMVIGTHAIFQESVVFKQLSLMIIDEQHRFGVHQRLQLKMKGSHFVPHQVVMTATPIPRTLAMTRYRDLDLTLIDELPPGRKHIQTLCINEAQRAEVITRVDHIIAQGQQIYWVCPLIEESEALQIQAAQAVLEELKQSFGDQVACIHGRMKADEKEHIMAQFKSGVTKVLVATTVIEVGVNVPNATLMVIENAERLGLAQLHQLRGRVGRGAQQSYCVLLFKSPLSQHAKQRLAVMRETNDGFKIAEMDLKIRGPGEVLGVRQTGLQAFKVADIFRDQALIYELNDYFQQNLAQLNQVSSNFPLWIGQRAEYQQV